MAIRGWVYVITNKSMSGLVKIGFSTKDPVARASELSAGAPYQYEVAYDVLVEDPQAVERSVHKLLAHKRKGKEWFHCSVYEAVNEIRSIIGSGAITENLSESRFISPVLSSTPINKDSAEYRKNRAYAIAKLKEEQEHMRKKLNEK